MGPTTLSSFYLDILNTIGNNDRSFVLKLLCNTEVGFRKPIDLLGNTFLQSAAKSTYGRILEMIIRCSLSPLDVNRKNCYGVTPLHVATASNNAAVCTMLLKNGADVKSTTNSEYTPLQYAIKYVSPKAFKWLLVIEGMNFKDQRVLYVNQNLNIN